MSTHFDGFSFLQGAEHLGDFPDCQKNNSLTADKSEILQTTEQMREQVFKVVF